MSITANSIINSTLIYHIPYLDDSGHSGWRVKAIITNTREEGEREKGEREEGEREKGERGRGREGTERERRGRERREREGRERKGRERMIGREGMSEGRR